MDAIALLQVNREGEQSGFSAGSRGEGEGSSGWMTWMGGRNFYEATPREGWI